jgi:hypothetical protein
MEKIISQFVTKPNQKSLKYYIFSTVVMAPMEISLTEFADEMLDRIL